MDHKKVSGNAELGSLARDSEKIKLRTDEEKAQLPAARARGGQLARATASDNLMQVDRSVQKRYRGLPGGALIFGTALVFFCCFGTFIQVERATLVAGISNAFPGLMDPESNVLTQQDKIAALVKDHKFTAAEDEYLKLIAHASKQFGDKDQRTVYLRLGLASAYLDMGKIELGYGLWRDQLKFLSAPQKTAPKQITNTLLQLARKYDDTFENKKAARELYLVTLRFWDHAPGNDTISNAETDLALIDEDEGRYAEANEYFRKALSYSRQWGKQHFNVFRLLHIGRTYIAMGNYKEAKGYLDEAMEMARAVGVAADQYIDPIKAAQYALKKASGGQVLSASEKAAGKGKMLDALYDDQQKLHKIWITGYNLYKANKMKEARPYLEEALKMSDQVGWPTGSDLQDLRDEVEEARAAK